MTFIQLYKQMNYNFYKKNIISSTLTRVIPQFVNRFIVLHIISKKYHCVCIYYLFNKKIF